ncbi:MAG: Imm32 family immunity protein [Enhydrobacter sp.]
MLTVEFNEQGECIEIYFDDDGLHALELAISRLRRRGGHDHLMTPALAGTELSEKLQGSGNRLMNHLVLVKVGAWP